MLCISAFYVFYSVPVFPSQDKSRIWFMGYSMPWGCESIDHIGICATTLSSLAVCDACCVGKNI